VTLKAHQKKMGEKNANVWYVFMAWYLSQSLPLTFLQLYHRHLDTACAVSDLRSHVPMLTRLGPDGMSSNETANKNDVPQYHLLGRNWCSLEVMAWLHVFDVIYCHNWYGPAGTGSWGNNARMCFESMSMGHPHRAVCRLLRNAYRAEWYNGLDQYDQEELDRCEDEVYAFMHIPNIQL
jgi:hypothetical protein